MIPTNSNIITSNRKSQRQQRIGARLICLFSVVFNLTSCGGGTTGKDESATPPAVSLLPPIIETGAGVFDQCIDFKASNPNSNSETRYEISYQARRTVEKGVYTAAIRLCESAVVSVLAKDREYTSQSVAAEFIIGNKKKIADNANQLFYHRASSYYYRGKHERVYFGWVDSLGALYVAYLDINEGTISPKVMIHDFGRPDDHATPTIFIPSSGKDQGKIFVSFSHHSSSLFFIKGTEAESLENLAPARIVTAERTT